MRGRCGCAAFEDRRAAGRGSPGHARGCVRLMGGDPPLARSRLALLCVVLCFITPPRAHRRAHTILHGAESKRVCQAHSGQDLLLLFGP